MAYIMQKFADQLTLYKVAVPRIIVSRAESIISEDRGKHSVHQVFQGLVHELVWSETKCCVGY